MCFLSSGLVEYKKAIEPVQLVSSTSGAATIINRYDFVTLDHLECVWSLVDETGTKTSDGGAIAIPSGVAPGAVAELELPQTTEVTGEALIHLSFRLKEATGWADAGFELAFAQVPAATTTTSTIPVYRIPTSDAARSFLTAEKFSDTVLRIVSDSSVWKFDTVRGEISSWSKRGVELLAKPPALDFWRAPTDNDAPQDGWDWKDRLLHLAKPQTRSVKWSSAGDDVVRVQVKQRIAPPVLSWSIDAEIEYTFNANGSVDITTKGTPQGDTARVNLPKTLPRIGFVFEMPSGFSNVQWFGRGPSESYRDSKFSQEINLYSVSSIDDLWVEYEFPQESSNRTDTRWVKFEQTGGIMTSGADLTAQFISLGGATVDERTTFDFQASHYRAADVDAAKHPFELKPKKLENVVVRLDAAHHGLGSGSCGPKTLDMYALKTEPFEFKLVLH